MPSRPAYAHHSDVLRLFMPRKTPSALLNASSDWSSDQEVIDAAIEDAASEFEQRTDDAYRLAKVRRPEVHRIPTGGHWAYRARFSGVTTNYNEAFEQVKLEHERVFAIDSAQGDTVEVRDGMTSWNDITANDSDQWSLIDPPEGIIEFDVPELFRDQSVNLDRSLDHVDVRLQYRYGSTGGTDRGAGETTLAGSGEVIASGDSTPITGQSVASASDLPPAPFVALLSGTEYVRVTAKDTSNDTIDIGSRNLRGTTAVGHDADDVVHYAPLTIRNAVAKKAAAELAVNQDNIESLTETAIDPETKASQWEQAFDDTVALLS